jgi:L-ribulose-5-phosphate 4-epimerase
MSFDALKQTCHRINLAIVEAGLVKLTWGNASVVDRAQNVMAIKPSGVAYAKLSPDDIVILSIATGERVEGSKNPSSDTPTHLHLFQQFPNIGAIVHTHSDYATSFSQALLDLPCMGTTHADHFYGTVPCTRHLRPDEIAREYELNTGKVIVETFRKRQIDPDQVPAVLVAGHAPFAWGATADKALENAIVVEYVAKMQFQSCTLRGKFADSEPIPQTLLDKHFLRKHGPGAYYGQPGTR